MAGRNHDERVDFLSAEIRFAYFIGSVDENIDTFVPVLVSSADSDEDGILRNILAGHCGSHFLQSESGGSAFFIIFFLCGRSEAVLESVRCHHIDRPSEEVLAFACRNLADCSEYVSILGRLLLQGIKSHHIELTSLIFRVV